MDPAIDASIISAVGNGVANLTGSALERRSQRRQQELARRQSLEDRAHNEFYNSPAQQRERMRQAGLGVSSDTVKTDDTSSEGMQYAQPFTNDILNSRATGLQQLSNAPAEAMKFALDIAEQTSKIKGLSSDNDLKDVTLKYADENARLALDRGYNELAQGIQQLDNLLAYGNLTKANEAKVRQDIAFAESLQGAKERLANAEASIAEDRKKISNATVQTAIDKANVELEQALANVRLTKSQITEISHRIANLDASTLNIKSATAILKETLTQEQLKTTYDQKTLEDRIDMLGSEAMIAENRANMSEVEYESALNDLSVYGMDKALGWLSSIVGVGTSIFNAGTTRLMATKPVYGNSMLVDQRGKPFVTRNGRALYQP